MKFLKTLTLGASLLIGTTAMAQDHIMRLSHGEPENNPTHVMAAKFEELVEKYTNGRIDVQIFGSNQLGSEQ